MSHFNKDKFEEQLRILRFDLDANQNKEFKDFFQLNLKNGTYTGSYFYNKRSEIKEKHFRNFLNILIQCLIDSFPKNALIDEHDKETINNILIYYSNKIIEEEKNKLVNAMASQSLQSGSSIVTETVKALENKLIRIKSYSKDVLSSMITSHNENAELNNPKIELQPSLPTNRTDDLISKIKNYRVASIIILIGIVVIYFGQVTDSFTKIKELIFTKTVQEVKGSKAVPIFPGETGWIFVGYYNQQKFIEGPYVSLENTTRSNFKRFVEIGDIIKLNVSRKLIIFDFGKRGTLLKLMSPIKAGEITADDETGIIIPSGVKLLVRDVSEGHTPNNPNIALWVRVVHLPQE